MPRNQLLSIQHHGFGCRFLCGSGGSQRVDEVVVELWSWLIVISGGLRGEGLACYSTAYQLWSDGLGDTSLVFIDLGSHIIMALSIKFL